MTFLRWKCPACSHSEDTPQDVLYQRLRGAGLLRRVSADEAQDIPYLLELARSVKSQLTCPDCGSGNYSPALAGDDAATEWGDSRKCIRCKAAISAERLEIFPDATLCAACQQKDECAEADSAEYSEEYCPRCGTPMQVRPRRGRGIVAYELACPSCGGRGR
jgi:hypothetical protein